MMLSTTVSGRVLDKMEQSTIRVVWVMIIITVTFCGCPYIRPPPPGSPQDTLQATSGGADVHEGTYPRGASVRKGGNVPRFCEHGDIAGGTHTRAIPRM